jgi:hypothetical protein
LAWARVLWEAQEVQALEQEAQEVQSVQALEQEEQVSALGEQVAALGQQVQHTWDL